MGDAFWCITLSIIVLRWWWKSGLRNRRKNIEKDMAAAEAQPIDEEALKAIELQKEVDKRREKDIADLKRQGYSDELIATILPVINDGQ